MSFRCLLLSTKVGRRLVYRQTRAQRIFKEKFYGFYGLTSSPPRISKKFRKRGHWNGVASVFSPFSCFLPFSSVFKTRFLAVFFHSLSVFFLFSFSSVSSLQFLSFFFHSVHFKNNGETPSGRPLLRNPEDFPKISRNWGGNLGVHRQIRENSGNSVELSGERKKPINIKNFGGTPPGVRPVCPGDTSHLSRDMSRLSRGHSVPAVLILHINQAQMSQVSLGRPEFVPGTPPGHPTAKFLYGIFLYRFFLSLLSGPLCMAPSIPLSFLPLFLGNSLFFSPCRKDLARISLFFERWPYFARDLRGSVGIKNPCPFGGFPCLSQKKTAKGRTGSEKKHLVFLLCFLGPRFLRTFPTLTPGCLGVKKFLPVTGAAGK